MHPMLNIAVRAARNAGNIIARAFEQQDIIDVEQKGLNDFVTNVDRDAEKAIINTILKSYPEHSIVGEEGGLQEGVNSDYQWIIDPLDGTRNFIQGIPHFSISIALKVKGKLDQAVVYDPMRSELFTASKGSGAQLNGYRIRVDNAKELEGTILATGFPFKHKHEMEPYFDILKSLFRHTADIRRAGSAALDLSYVAAGRLDGYFEIGLKPWDSAAGQLILKEAGGIVTDFVGGTNFNKSGNIIAGNSKIVQAILKEMRPHLPETLRK